MTSELNNIDLRALYEKCICPYKRRYFIWTFAAGFIFAVISLCIEPTYNASVVFTVRNDDSANAGRLQSLMSRAMSFSSSPSRQVFNLNYLSSRELADAFIEKYELRKVFYEDYFSDGEFNSTVRFVNPVRWLKQQLLPSLDINQYKDEDVVTDGGPSKELTYKRFQEVFRVEIDKSTGLIVLNVFWKNPLQAKLWANDFIKFSDERLRKIALSESQQKVLFLKQELLVEDSPSELKYSIATLLNSELSQQTDIMAKKDYVFQVIQRAFLPEKKVKPHRKRWLLFGLAVGFLACFVKTYRRVQS
jgi:uncharacterized protein involved in exopolysaccharide biosynthesis